MSPFCTQSLYHSISIGSISLLVWTTRVMPGFLVFEPAVWIGVQGLASSMLMLEEKTYIILYHTVHVYTVFMYIIISVHVYTTHTLLQPSTNSVGLLNGLKHPVVPQSFPQTAVWSKEFYKESEDVKWLKWWWSWCWCEYEQWNVWFRDFIRSVLRHMILVRAASFACKM